MSTEWTFVEDVLPPPDEDVMVTDGDEVSLARRTDDGKWEFVYPDDVLTFAPILLGSEYRSCQTMLITPYGKIKDTGIDNTIDFR